MESEDPRPAARIAVTVCICTFRRPSVLRAVESVARQKLPPAIAMRVLVVDNDASPSAKDAIEEFRATTSAEIGYRHAPGQNISIARNAALDATSTPWLAFLDDDEYASSDWLAKLVAARQGAEAVFGPCEAIYRSDAPSWIKSSDYHSNRILHPGKTIDTGYTSNALIDMGFVRRKGLAFDPALGETGGEDTMFFHAMHKNGGRLGYAPDAIVYEEVAPTRLNLAWVLRRRYRAGQVYAMMIRALRSFRLSARRRGRCAEDFGLPRNGGRDDPKSRACHVVADAGRLPLRRVELQPRRRRASGIWNNRLIAVDRSPPLQPVPPTACGGAPVASRRRA